MDHKDKAILKQYTTENIINIYFRKYTFAHSFCIIIASVMNFLYSGNLNKTNEKVMWSQYLFIWLSFLVAYKQIVPINHKDRLSGKKGGNIIRSLYVITVIMTCLHYYSLMK